MASEKPHEDVTIKDDDYSFHESLKEGLDGGGIQMSVVGYNLSHLSVLR